MRRRGQEREMDGRRRPHWAEAAFQAYRPGKVHVTSGGFVEAYEGLIAVGEDGWLDYASETWTGPDGKDGSDTILTRFPRERVELVEWMDDPLVAERAQAGSCSYPARVTTELDGSSVQFTGAVAQEREGWLDLRFLGPVADEVAEVLDPRSVAVSLPRGAVLLVEMLGEWPDEE